MITNKEFLIQIFESLTKTEELIVFHSIKSLSNLEISEKLFISEKTVKKHKNNISQKFNVFGQTEFRKLIRELNILVSNREILLLCTFNNTNVV